MSAGKTGEYPGEPPLSIESDLDCLAPKFREKVEALLVACEAAGLDAIVHESYRSDETQGIYYRRGRTTIPPRQTVTNARTNQYSWHGYALAVDIISKSKGWDAGEEWFTKMGELAESLGLEWGGRWKRADTPHVQFGGMKDTPSDHARALLASGGIPAVWQAVNAA